MQARYLPSYLRAYFGCHLVDDLGDAAVARPLTDAIDAVPDRQPVVGLRIRGDRLVTPVIARVQDEPRHLPCHDSIGLACGG